MKHRRTFIPCGVWPVTVSALALALGIALFAPSGLVAATPPTFTVSSGLDAGADPADTDYSVCRTAANNNNCTLRAAIMKANRFAGGGVTIILPNGTHTLSLLPVGADDDSSGDLNITQTVTIAGAGAATAIIDGGGIDGVFYVSSGVTATISGVTIRNGNAGLTGSGGGIDNYGTLTVSNSAINANSAGLGGAVFNETLATLTLNDTALSGNSAVLNSGGGLENNGTATLNRSTINGNTASGSGAGLSNRNTMTVNNSTISHNRAAGSGGGIFNGSVLTMNDTTLSANAAVAFGGGIYHSGASARLFHVTIAGNLADAGATSAGHGGGIANGTALTIGLWNSLLAENHAGSADDDCVGNPLTSHDHNYIQSSLACLQSPMAHDISGGDPLLGPLQDNGGATPTRSLLTGSPALDQIPSSECVDSSATAPHPDQRGVTRPLGPLCDIGASEGVQPLFAYNRNLIRNGDAESGGASPGGAFVGVPNWRLISNGHFTAVPYNAPGFPSVPPDTVPANHGSNFFAGGNLTDTVATQFVDVSAASAAIDAGNLPFTLSADLGGYLTQNDAATVKATFLDSTFSIVGTPLTIGPVTAADRGNLTSLLHRSAMDLVPATTRTIEIDMRMIWTTGYNDGYADNLSFVLTSPPPPTLANISTRLRVETGDNVLIGGFIVTGTQPKRVIVRAIGPSLPLAGALGDPVLELHGPGAFATITNDNWRSNQEAEIMATTIPPGNDLESAIVATLPANNSAYTAIVRGVNNGTGIGVVEAYDLDRTVDSKLANISTRGFVHTGDDVLIGGLIVVGQDPLRVIVRAIGPSLPLPGALGDPTLELHDVNGALIASNDNWRSDQEAEIIATAIPPSNDLESAIVRNLTPGNYTAIVRGVNNSTGVALVEAYGLN